MTTTPTIDLQARLDALANMLATKRERKKTCDDCGAEMEFNKATWEGDPSLPDGTRDVPACWACDCGRIEDGD